MMNKLFVAALIISCLNCGFASSFAVDDFDDGLLDPMWYIGYTDTDETHTTWVENQEASSVFDLISMETAQPGEPKWTNFYLAHPLVVDTADLTLGLDDFHIDFYHGYQLDPCDPSERAYLQLLLRSGGSGYEMSVGYEDKSDSAYGYPTFWGYDNGAFSQAFGISAAEGFAEWEINRVNGQVSVYLNGELMSEISNDKPLSEIRIFWQARYLNGFGGAGAWLWDDYPRFPVDWIRVLPRSPQREISWTGSVDMNWNTPGNWSDMAAPDADTIVTILDAANLPEIPVVSDVNFLYVDVVSGTLDIQGTLDVFSMEIGETGHVNLGSDSASITLFGNQRDAMAALLQNGKLGTDMPNRYLRADYFREENVTVIEVIVPVIEQVVNWQFDQTSGTTVSDDSGKGNHGTFTGMNGAPLPSWALNAGHSGMPGDHAVSFPGDPNSFVELFNGIDMPVNASDGWTMNLWVKMDQLPSGTNDGVMIAGMGRVGESGVSTGAIRALRDTQGVDPAVGVGFYGIGASYYTQETWTQGDWQMITFTMDYMLNLKMYKNGYLIANVTPDLTDAEPMVSIAKSFEAGFKGLVDDFGIWSYPMTQKEIVTDLWQSWICGAENDNQPLGDLNGNCVVDFADVALLGIEWLNGQTIVELKALAESWLTDGKIYGDDL